jgi:hypothetical protein
VAEHDAGVLIEDENVAILSREDGLPLLSAAIIEALDSSRELPVSDRRESKRSDWPAYKASGCRSIRQFEQDFLLVRIESANVAHHFVYLEGFPEHECELTVRCSSVPSSPELGSACIRIIDACRARQF